MSTPSETFSLPEPIDKQGQDSFLSITGRQAIDVGEQLNHNRPFSTWLQ
jgi:hypothetical protein